MLLGGSGTDTLFGGNVDDLLYGGVLVDDSDMALMALATLWYSDRNAAISAIETDSTTDDPFADTLDGEGGNDWYAVFANDAIANTEKFPPNLKFLLS